MGRRDAFKHLKAEVAAAIKLFAISGPRSERERGQLEALQYVATCIEVAEYCTRPRKKKTGTPAEDVPGGITNL